MELTRDTPKAVPVDHRANNFDFLRLFLSVSVLFSHSFDLLVGHEDDPVLRLTHGQITLGQIAVNGFFLISGYLITQSWIRSKSVGDFALKRILRIYPGFISILLVDMLIVGPLSGVNLHRYFHNFSTYRYLSMIFLTYCHLPGVFPTNPGGGEVNGSLWTIRFEITCYVLVAVLGLAKLLNRSRSLVVWALSIAFWLTLRHLHHRLPFIGEPDQLPRLAAFYLTGTLFCVWEKSIRYTALGIVLAAVLVVTADLLHGLIYVLPICETYLLLALAYSPAVRLHNVGRYGDFSYGIYLCAFPIQQLLVRFFLPDLTPLTLFLYALPPTLVAAFLSWHLVENPALQLKSRLKPPIKQ